MESRNSEVQLVKQMIGSLERRIEALFEHARNGVEKNRQDIAELREDHDNDVREIQARLREVHDTAQEAHAQLLAGLGYVREDLARGLSRPWVWIATTIGAAALAWVVRSVLG